MGGGPLNGVRNTVESQIENFNAELELVTNENKKSKKVVTAANQKKSSDLISMKPYAGTRAQLFEQVTELLPTLRTFCTTGLTADCPPVAVGEHAFPAGANKNQPKGEFDTLNYYVLAANR